MFQIIPATPAHYPVIQQIATYTWHKTYGNIITQAQTDFMLDWMYSLASINEQVEKQGHRFIMAVENNAFTGFASYELNYKGEPKTKVHKLYVLPEQQGSGTGRKLLDFIGNIALSHDHIAISLNVNRFNAAVDFYKKTGFTIVEEEDIDIGHGYVMEDYVMERSLGRDGV
jgi:GNAT superfamily N-acetyltransferase